MKTGGASGEFVQNHDPRRIRQVGHSQRVLQWPTWGQRTREPGWPGPAGPPFPHFRDRETLPSGPV